MGKEQKVSNEGTGSLFNEACSLALRLSPFDLKTCVIGDPPLLNKTLVLMN